jgi:hypothetical protein
MKKITLQKTFKNFSQNGVIQNSSWRNFEQLELFCIPKSGLFTIIFLIGFLISSLTSTAQVASYGFSQSSGTYTALSGGTTLGSTTTDEQLFFSGTSGTLTATSGTGYVLPFNFTYNGVVYDRIGVSANGWIALGQSALGSSAVDMSSSSVYSVLSSTVSITPSQLRARIAVLNANLQAQTGASIKYQTTGIVPNRIFAIQFTKYKIAGTDGAGQSLNFQLRLMEGTNEIKIVFGLMTFNTISSTAQVGLGGASSTDFNNRTTSSNWNVTTSGLLNTDSLTLSTAVTPPTSGTTFTWTPPAVCTGTPTAGTISGTTVLCSGSSTNLSVTGYTTGVSGLTFQWEESDDNGVTDTWANAVGGSGATSISYTTAAISNAIYYRVKVTCSGSGLFALTPSKNVTLSTGTAPAFTPAAAICSGVTLSALPTNSTNSITGTWSPALNNTATTTYTFTPTAGQCATTATMTITVTPNVTPTFTQVSAICSGGSVPVLPSVSTGVPVILGTWSPAIVSNTVSEIHTFIPNAGQCATTTTMNIDVITTTAPTGLANQTFVTGQTIADIVVAGTGITWYADAALTTPLPTPTLLVDATTYYATQTSNGCTSTSLAVIVTVNLTAQSFEINSTMVYPNPATSTLTIQNNSNTSIDKIIITDLTGKVILTQTNSPSLVNVASLAAGMYIIEATFGKEKYNWKFVKE